MGREAEGREGGKGEGRGEWREKGGGYEDGEGEGALGKGTSCELRK